jgi:hypothetical protein
MDKRKFTTKQERELLIQDFLESGKSQFTWCKEHDIKNSTFGKWIRDYKSSENEVKFIPLAPKAETRQPQFQNPHEILIEIGSCRIHVPEHIGIQFLMQAVKAVSESDVSIH